MTFYCNSVKKCTCLAFFCLLCLFSAPAWANDGFIIKPVNEADQVRLLSSHAWPHSSEQAELMLKLAYLRGLLDAWQLSAIAPKASASVLEDLQGVSLTELVIAIDAYYQQEDENHPLPPASIVLRIIPKYYKEELVNHE